MTDAPESKVPDSSQGVTEQRALQAERDEIGDGSPFVGLAFSGGGIRSATFNLGVIQALAQHGYLTQIDYLSTVSGGGYIGSWLAAWIKRSGVGSVQRTLAQNTDPSPPAQPWRFLEPDPVRFLRNFSNYLAPRTGLASTDTWALLSVYVRNVLLNLALLVAGGAAGLLLPMLALSYASQGGLDHVALYNRAFLTVIVSLLFAMSAVAYSFAAFSATVEPTSKLARSVVKRPGWFAVFPLLLASVCMTYLLVRESNAGTLYDFVLHNPLARMLNSQLGKYLQGEKAYWIATGALWYTAICAVGNLIANLIEALQGGLTGLLKTGWRALVGLGSGPRPVTKSYVLPLLFTLVSGAFGGFLLYLLHYMLAGFSGPWVSIVAARLLLGAPLMLFTFLLVSILHVGLLGRSFPDAKREWLARFCGMKTLVAGGWLALIGFALYGAIAFKFLFTSSWAHSTWGRVIQAIVASGWVGTTLAGLIGANRSNGKPQNGAAKTSLLLKLAPPVFILGLALLLSGGLDAWLARLVDSPKTTVQAAAPEDYRAMIQNASSAGSAGAFARQFSKLIDLVTPQSARAAANDVSAKHWAAAKIYLDWHERRILFLLLALLIAAVVLAWRLDVNEFSIHLLYRNRLVRCYLGASRGNQRQPQAFTGFDVNDDLPLARLTTQSTAPADPANGRPVAEKAYNGPYPLICTALNLVGGKNLAWQMRKARSFIYSPLFCGYDFFTTFQTPSRLGQHAFRETNLFSGKDGPYLGTALAISGAAASPNMGYHSSPALTFLMAVFDVRLGWWGGNTRHDSTWKQSGPKSAAYLVKELFGRTDDESRFVYLSDGGHFENLGLYELVRRKIPYILVCDAGADELLTFSDLGNAIEKCRRDLGAEINIDLSQLRKKKTDNLSQAHFAYGTITYKDGSPGKLLYLKSTLTGKEPADVQAYSTAHSAFPHDSTAEQFFNETQFESYRALGQHCFASIVKAVTDAQGDGAVTPVHIQNLFEALEYIATPATATAGSIEMQMAVGRMSVTFAP